MVFAISQKGHLYDFPPAMYFSKIVATVTKPVVAGQRAVAPHGEEHVLGAANPHKRQTSDNLGSGHALHLCQEQRRPAGLGT
jgi:hypothetical protein